MSSDGKSKFKHSLWWCAEIGEWSKACANRSPYTVGSPHRSPLCTWHRVILTVLSNGPGREASGLKLYMSPATTLCVLFVLQPRNAPWTSMRKRSTKYINVLFVLFVKALQAKKFKLAIPAVKQLWTEKSMRENMKVLVWMFSCKIEK